MPFAKSFLSKHLSAIITLAIALITVTVTLGAATSQIGTLTSEVSTLKIKEEVLQQKMQNLEIADTADRELLKYISKNVDEIKSDIKELEQNGRSHK